MYNDESDRIIIVEGLTDKKQIEKVINDEVTILCTNGTFDVEHFDELLEVYDLDHRDVYILVDEDESGMKLRKQLTHELPHAEHLHVSEEYGEVAATPTHLLAILLVSKHINVYQVYLQF